MTVSFWAVFMTVWAWNLGCVIEPGEPGPDSPLLYINTWAMVWPNDYPALATWNVHGNQTDPVWTCLWWAASVTGSVSPCTKPSAVSSTALIQRILTDRCLILTDRQYTVQGLLFSAHSAHTVHNTYRYMQILADTCRYFVYVSYSHWSICRYDVGILCRYHCSIFAVSTRYL